MPSQIYVGKFINFAPALSKSLAFFINFTYVQILYIFMLNVKAIVFFLAKGSQYLIVIYPNFYHISFRCHFFND